MSAVSTRTARSALAALAAGVLFLTGCSSGGGGDEQSETEAKKQGKDISYSFADAAASKGPAPEVEGAREGGTIKMLQRDTFSHLDPAQIYVSDEISLSTLIHRRLTNYKRNKDGSYSVVGDLATDSGKKSDGGKTWTYKLKDGIRFEDGSEITSKDIRHTIERTFAPFITEGPTFLQEWMTGKGGTEARKSLPDGPYKGDHLPDSMLETPDDKTIVFHFKQPQAEVPYALAMSGYGVVSAKKDTKEKYDKKPLCSGPYKIASFKSGKSMKLVRNTEWDPKTDAQRHQYPDAFDVQFGVSFEDSTKRLISDSGENRTATSFTNSVDASSMQKVRSNPEVEKRSVSGYQSYVGYMAINTDRITDKRVRQAIAYALPADSLVGAFGGTGAAEMAGNYISPTLVGHKPTDPFGKIKNPQGDVKKAKKLLKASGKSGMKLTFAYQNAPEWQQFSVAATQNLKKAGFDVQKKDIIADTYYDQIGKIKNGFDIYHHSWGADWPSASTVVPNLFDGRQVQDGAANYAHLKNEKFQQEMDRIRKITDPDKAAAEWMKLADRILKAEVPAVPLQYYKTIQLHGSKIGGAYFDESLHDLMPTSLYVKK
ncbi:MULTISPECIES: ABC transporter substrate-binding protein [Streptomyces]|uniref:ABC transporter n=1 Tax=Streptomyces cacaoi TaxID=1898 RepID=A0A4Y3R464_STRCI|nr:MULTISPECIES: ABC transporter substrate-binding protein [Streptomyces]NNG85259.1 ABC transporter substrate-binding protein [Streptomyces cacaoi]QHF97113.1 ABC transporter substrate-binding protein [Streptomyces sp. NHF165]GEB52149.1 ABC transporter [Streptomyces cacaoi]